MSHLPVKKNSHLFARLIEGDESAVETIIKRTEEGGYTSIALPSTLSDEMKCKVEKIIRRAGI